jgi:hypothetical protein
MNIITKFLLARGLSKGPEIISKLVRHGMGWVGGYLGAHALASAEQLATLESAALILGSIAWSVSRTFLSEKLPQL